MQIIKKLPKSAKYQYRLIFGTVYCSRQRRYVVNRGVDRSYKLDELISCML